MERLSRQQSLVLRSRVIRSVRSFFEERSYLEVETPIWVPSPGLDLHLDAFAVEGGGYLITSPEYQMKRLLAEGLTHIFQIARCFRRDEVGRQHNPEFTMLEWYRADMLVDEMMTETEDLVRAVLQAHSNIVLPPVDRLTVCEAFETYAGLNRAAVLEMAAHDEDQFFLVLVDQIEPALAKLEHPVFLCDYPSSQASLARIKPGDPEVCERFELYYRGVELCNGFGELTDPVEQRARLEADREARRQAGKPLYPIDEKFLAALARGMPAASGNALGLDRLIAICAGTDDIADVLAFTAATV